MIDERDLYQGAIDKFPPPERSFELLGRRRERKQRNKRISAGVVALVIVALSAAGFMKAFGGLGETPATRPTPPPDQGIFTGLGGWIVYGLPPDGIWAADPQRPGTVVRVSTTSGEPLAWSRDGSKLLILRHETKRSDLLILNADGTETLVVTFTCPIFPGASLSPDGTKVLYTCETSNGSNYRLYVVDASGGPPRRIGPRDLTGQDGVFSPDGSKIAYFSGGGDYNNALSVMDADGSNSHVVLRAGMMPGPTVGNLGWFPDGRRLLFGRTCCGRVGGPNWKMYAVNADGSGLTPLGHGPNPMVSPDGSRIASGSTGSDFGGMSLTIENVDGTHVQHFPYAAPGAWDPLPYEPNSEAHSTSSSPGATRPDMLTYSIAALLALGVAAFWLRRRRTPLPEVKDAVE